MQLLNISVYVLQFLSCSSYLCTLVVDLTLAIQLKAYDGTVEYSNIKVVSINVKALKYIERCPPYFLFQGVVSSVD